MIEGLCPECAKGEKRYCSACWVRVSFGGVALPAEEDEPPT